MIDCDIHVQIGDPEEFCAYVEPAQREWFLAQGELLGLPSYNWSHPGGWFRHDLESTGPRSYPGTSIERVIAEVLDPMGTDIGMLTADDGVLAGVMANPYRARAYARAHNDWMADRWLGADPRVRGSIIVPTQEPLEAAREINRMAVDRRFTQVLLVGGSERPYGDPRYLPILEACVANDLVLTIHSGGEGMGVAAMPGGAGPPNFYIEWHTLGSACSIMAHLVSLVVNGCFDRLPALRVLLMEGGLAWLPGILWRLDTNWRGLRGETPWLDRRPSEIVREHIRFTTQPLEHTDGHDALLFEMLEAAGAPDILCFSSDYPHWDGDDPQTMLKRLPESWRAKVMHDTAAAMFRL